MTMILQGKGFVPSNYQLFYHHPPVQQMPNILQFPQIISKVNQEPFEKKYSYLQQPELKLQNIIPTALPKITKSKIPGNFGQNWLLIFQFIGMNELVQFRFLNRRIKIITTEYVSRYLIPQYSQQAAQDKLSYPNDLDAKNLRFAYQTFANSITHKDIQQLQERCNLQNPELRKRYQKLVFAIYKILEEQKGIIQSWNTVNRYTSLANSTFKSYEDEIFNYLNNNLESFKNFDPMINGKNIKLTSEYSQSKDSILTAIQLSKRQKSYLELSASEKLAGWYDSVVDYKNVILEKMSKTQRNNYVKHIKLKRFIVIFSLSSGDY